MKTIQDYFRKLNKDEIIRYYLSYYPFTLKSDEELIDDEGDSCDCLLSDVWKYHYTQLNNLVERIRNLEVKENTEGHIFFVHHIAGTGLNDLSVSLIKEKEAVEAVKNNEVCDAYAYEFSPIEETAGYYVADTYLTQREIMDVLCDYIDESIFFGYEQEFLEDEKSVLENRVKAVKENKDNPQYFVPLSDVIERMAEKTGWTPENRDPSEEKEYRKLIKAEMLYNKRAFIIELKKVIESL